MEIRTFRAISEVAEATLTLLASGTVGLSGGSTYAELLKAWAALHPPGIGADFYPVDERLVPISHEASNWGMAAKLFFNPLGLQKQIAHHAASLSQYKTLLGSAFGAAIPVFDVLFLGIGDDGHTASLFPGDPSLDNHSDAVLETCAPKAPHERLTLGPQTIGNARQIVSILSGSGKEGIAQRVMAADPGLPFISVTRDHPRHILWLDEKLSPLH